jgi:hypothetical protein
MVPPRQTCDSSFVEVLLLRRLKFSKECQRIKAPNEALHTLKGVPLVFQLTFLLMGHPTLQMNYWPLRQILSSLLLTVLALAIVTMPFHIKKSKQIEHNRLKNT